MRSLENCVSIPPYDVKLSNLVLLFFILLKLYCDCFRNGMICGAECKCKKCQNTEQGNGPDGMATQARDAIRERRPDAFETRVVKVGEGCSCKKNR